MTATLSIVIGGWPQNLEDACAVPLTYAPSFYWLAITAAPIALNAWPVCLCKEWAQSKNHRNDGSRCQSRCDDANGSVGMVCNHAICDWRQSPGAKDASVE